MFNKIGGFLENKTSQFQLHRCFLFLEGNSARASPLLDVDIAVAAAHGRTPSYKYSRTLFPKAFLNTRCIILTEGARADPILYNELEAKKAAAVHAIYKRITSFCRKEFLGCLTAGAFILYGRAVSILGVLDSLGSAN